MTAHKNTWFAFFAIFATAGWVGFSGPVTVFPWPTLALGVASWLLERIEPNYSQPYRSISDRALFFGTFAGIVLFYAAMFAIIPFVKPAHHPERWFQSPVLIVPAWLLWLFVGYRCWKWRASAGDA